MSIGLFQFLRLSRLFDAIFPVVSVFLGATVVGHFEDRSAILLALVILILNSVAIIWNDIEDRKIDADNGRSELIRSSPSTIRRLWTYVVVFVAVSLVLALVVSVAAFVLCLVAIFLTWVYNSKPVQASRRPIASIIILSGTGAFLPYLFGISLGGITQNTLIAGAFWWIGRMSLSVLKDYKDARGDAIHHKKTFLLRYGARWVARVSVACLIVGYTGFIVLMNIDATKSWVLLLLGIGVSIHVYIRRQLFNSKATYRQLDKVFRTVAQYQLLLDVGILLWLI